MKKFTQFLKISTLVFFLVFGLTSIAQVGIGTTTPSAGSIFDVTSANKGVLVPRVNIISLTTIAPVTGGATDGLLVWNTNATTGSGYHYWSVPASRWIPLIPATATSNDWSILGNAGTVNATNFLGTTTAGRELNIRTANVNRMRVQANGQVTVNYGAVQSGAGDIFSSTGLFPINGYTANGFGVYGDATSGFGVYGTSGTGRGVYGESDNFIGVHGNTNSGLAVYGQSLSNIAVLGVTDSLAGVQGESTFGAGVAGFGTSFGTYGEATGLGVGARGISPNGFGVAGTSTGGTGVYGQATSVNGVWGRATANGIGVRGQAVSSPGVLGTSETGIGVSGFTLAGPGVSGTGTTFGVRGQVIGLGTGVQGSTAAGIGVRGITTSGIGVLGQGTSGSGVVGLTANDSLYAGSFSNSDPLGHGLVAAGNNQLYTVVPGTGAGVTGTGLNIGIVARAAAPVGDGLISLGNGLLTYVNDPFDLGSGVVANSSNIGVYAYTTTTLSNAVYADGGTAAGGSGITARGRDGVQGVTTDIVNGYGVFSFGDSGAAGVKFFHIDHPLDPSNKYLNHASIESNEILNLYRGTEVFDGSGRATVSLPDYYDAINKNASYQLTPIGAAMPNLYIEKEIENGKFIIAGGISGKKVSWQLTAERNDPYLQQYPEKRNMVVDKGEKRGTYLMPELYGKTKEQAFTYRNTSSSEQKPNLDARIHQMKNAKAPSISNPQDDEKLEIPELPEELKEDKEIIIKKADVLEKSKKVDAKENVDDENVAKKIKTVESLPKKKE